MCWHGLATYLMICLVIKIPHVYVNKVESSNFIGECVYNIHLTDYISCSFMSREFFAVFFHSTL